ncbi:hypothetical protein NKH18_25070 [Streptomyces sp. M10(2022)]
MPWPTVPRRRTGDVLLRRCCAVAALLVAVAVIPGPSAGRGRRRVFPHVPDKACRAVTTPMRSVMAISVIGDRVSPPCPGGPHLALFQVSETSPG